MNERQQNIISLHDQAAKLVENIGALYQHAGSYKNAKDELDVTNKNLLNFIEQTQTLANESHKIISELNKIGSSRIFDKMDILEEKQKSNEKQSKKYFMFSIIVAVIILILQIISLVKG